MIIRIALAAVAATAIAACGAAKTPTSSQSGPDSKQRTALLKFAQCMRDHGVAMQDPKFDGNGGSTIQIDGGPGSKQDPHKLDAAQKACEKYQKQAGPKSAPSEQDQAKFRKQALKNAQCMRDNGVPDFPDPQFGDNGTVKMALPPGVNPRSATFQAAQKKCMVNGGGIGMRTSADGGQ
jgi:hypothetical protein